MAQFGTRGEVKPPKTPIQKAAQQRAQRPKGIFGPGTGIQKPERGTPLLKERLTFGPLKGF